MTDKSNPAGDLRAPLPFPTQPDAATAANKPPQRDRTLEELWNRLAKIYKPGGNDRFYSHEADISKQQDLIEQAIKREAWQAMVFRSTWLDVLTAYQRQDYQTIEATVKRHEERAAKWLELSRAILDEARPKHYRYNLATPQYLLGELQNRRLAAHTLEFWRTWLLWLGDNWADAWPALAGLELPQDQQGLLNQLETALHNDTGATGQGPKDKPKKEKALPRSDPNSRTNEDLFKQKYHC